MNSSIFSALPSISLICDFYGKNENHNQESIFSNNILILFLNKNIRIWRAFQTPSFLILISDIYNRRYHSSLRFRKR
jgi:hypothetical protein